MNNSITPNQIKQTNRHLIYQYIYKKRKVSQQDICFDLRLSRPTVTTNLNELEKDGLIKKCGQINTEYVGRKASAYAISADYRVSIGVEILRNEVKMIAVDLYGQKIDHLTYAVKYENQENYYSGVCNQILHFKDSLELMDEQILGVGFAMQALISPDNQSVIYGKILGCTGLSIEVFQKQLPYPCRFFHDADSAATAELWVTPELENAIYLSLSKHLGAAIICDGSISSGKHGHSATIEHIPLVSNGELCYCGNYGCVDTLCSIHALLHHDETLDTFFENVKLNNEDYKKRWEAFLINLAKTLNIVRLIYDTDFILGGYLAPHLTEADILFIHEEIQKSTPFPVTADFIRISKMPKHNIAIGAALPYIQEFLNTL